MPLHRRSPRSCGHAGPLVEALEPRSLLTAALPLVILSVADAGAAEHDSRPGKFTITRFGNTDAPLLVYFQIAGSATPGVDYTGLSGATTIPAGRRSVMLPIIPIDDLEVEGPETVRVILSPDNAHYRLDQSSTLNRNRVITIQDDDMRPVVTIAAPDPNASEIGGDTATLTIRRTGATDLPLTVDLRIAGSATPGVDYQALPTSITIQPGRHAAFLTINAFNDALLEGNETVRVILQSPEDNRYTLSPDQPALVRRSAFILDRPLVSILVTDPVATSFPADTAEFVVFRSGPTDRPLQVSYRFTGSAIAGVDFALVPVAITIPAGTSFTRVVIRGLDADLTQQVKTLRLTLLPLSTYNLDTSPQGRTYGEVSIIDDGVPPGV